MGSALERVGVRQHARAESISKRAPSSASARVEFTASYAEMSRRSGAAVQENNHSDISPALESTTWSGQHQMIAHIMN
jgi:hypothetical protein